MMQPVMRFKELPSQLGFKRTLLELYVPAPTRSVSIVLDMSDSCPPIRDIAQQLPKLLVKHAKQSPLWIYRLSNKLALNEGHQNTVGHLTDGSISLLSWLDDRSLVEKASRTGSTLRRVIESIQERDRNVEFSESLTIVLTDGKLLDRAAIELPPKLRLVGICPEITSASQEHWNRVVYGSPLIAWNSPLLTHSTFDNADLTGKYAVSFVGLDVGSYEYFDPTRKTLQPATDGMRWSPRGGAFTVIVSSPTSLSPNFRVELRGIEGPANTSLSLHNATHLQADDREPDGLSSITKEVHGFEECVFDSAAGQLEPSTIERIVAEIEALAQAREAWTAKTECIRAIIATADKAPEPFDAVLCLTQRDGDQLRLVVIALRKALSPTLNWPANSLSLCGLSNQLVRVAYDRMEGRWQAVIGDGAPTLLDPRSSQDIDGRLRFDDCEWACIYSGPLPT